MRMQKIIQNHIIELNRKMNYLIVNAKLSDNYDTYNTILKQVAVLIKKIDKLNEWGNRFKKEG